MLTTYNRPNQLPLHGRCKRSAHCSDQQKVAPDSCAYAQSWWARTVQPHQRLTRDEVIDALWPQLEPEAGGANLRKAAHHARQALGRHDAIVLQAGEVLLWPERPVVVDALRFEQRADAAGEDAPMPSANENAGEPFIGLMPTP